MYKLKKKENGEPTMLSLILRILQWVVASLCTNQLKLSGYTSQDYVTSAWKTKARESRVQVTWQTQSYMTKKLKWNSQRNETATVYSPEVRKSYWDSCYWLAGNVLYLSSGLIFHHFGISPSLLPSLPPFPLVSVCVCRTCVDSSRVKQLFAYPWLKIVSSSVGKAVLSVQTHSFRRAI